MADSNFSSRDIIPWKSHSLRSQPKTIWIQATRRRLNNPLKWQKRGQQEKSTSEWICISDRSGWNRQKEAITNEKIKALRHPNRELNNTHRQKWPLWSRSSTETCHRCYSESNASRDSRKTIHLQRAYGRNTHTKSLFGIRQSVDRIANVTTMPLPL